MKRVIQYFSRKYLAAWVLLMSDTVLVFISYILASILRFNFELKKIDSNEMFVHGIITMVIYAGIFIISQTSTAVLRYSGLNDLIKVMRTGFISFIILIIPAVILLYGFDYRGFWLFPKSILIIQYLLVCFLLSLSRLIAKETYSAFLKYNSDLKSNIMIFGAGELGRVTYQTLQAGRTERKTLTSIICFIDDDRFLHKKSIEGLPIYSPKKALKKGFIEKNRINQVIISMPNLSNKRMQEITDFCLQNNLEVREIPPLDKWIHGELSTKQILPVKIENLLGRGEISLDSENVKRELKGKIILITGGAGSIGSELVRQALFYDPKKIIVFDQAESGIFDLENSLKNEFANRTEKLQSVVGDITNYEKIKNVFKENKPDIVFHAAAYKHVPLMEKNPYEAIRTNVFGTKQVADLALEFEVKKFVLVSSDKAVNPTSVMGATKRIGEKYLQILNRIPSNTQFIITRFGNVLESSGSVIPLFRKQIESGGPITVTHKEINRYFMTISEASNLVLEAGSMGSDGEIFVFDMGEPVKIYDMAVRMIQLSGLTINKDIRIEIVGLRPGEKLYEEILSENEKLIPTHHSKIRKAAIEPMNTNEFMNQISELANQLVDRNIDSVRILKKMIPEFISNNSEFEKLDKSS